MKTKIKQAPLLHNLPESLKKIAAEKRQQTRDSGLPCLAKEIFERLLTDNRMVEVYDTLAKYEDKVDADFEYGYGDDLYSYFFLKIFFMTPIIEINQPISITDYQEDLVKIKKSTNKLIEQINTFPWHKYKELNNFTKIFPLLTSSDDQWFRYATENKGFLEAWGTLYEIMPSLPSVLGVFESNISDAIQTPPHTSPYGIGTYKHIKLICMLSALMQELFGKWLDEVVATTTEVALNLEANEIKASNVIYHRKKRSIPPRKT